MAQVQEEVPAITQDKPSTDRATQSSIHSQDCEDFQDAQDELAQTDPVVGEADPSHVSGDAPESGEPVEEVTVVTTNEEAETNNDGVTSEGGDGVTGEGVEVVTGEGVTSEGGDGVTGEGVEVVTGDVGDGVTGDVGDGVTGDGGDGVTGEGGDGGVGGDGGDGEGGDGVTGEGGDGVTGESGEGPDKSGDITSEVGVANQDDDSLPENSSDEEHVQRRRRRGSSVENEESGDGVESGAGDGVESGAGDSVESGAGDSVESGAGDGVESEGGDGWEEGEGGGDGDGWEEREDAGEFDQPEKEEEPQGPMYVPTRGKFFQHDHRLGDEEEVPAVVVEEKLSREDKVERWDHDLYVEANQAPRTQEEKERDARFWAQRDRDDGRGGRVRLGRFVREEDREKLRRDNRRRSYDQQERSGDYQGRSRGRQNRSGGFEGRSRDREERSGGFEGRSHDREERSGGFEGRSHDREERSGGFEGRSHDREERSGGFEGRSHDREERSGGFEGRSRDREERSRVSSHDQQEWSGEGRSHDRRRRDRSDRRRQYHEETDEGWQESRGERGRREEGRGRRGRGGWGDRDQPRRERKDRRSDAPPPAEREAPQEDWPSLGELPQSNLSPPQWPVAPSPVVEDTQPTTPTPGDTPPKSQRNPDPPPAETTPTQQVTPSKPDETNESPQQDPAESKSPDAVDKPTQSAPPRSRSLFNTSRQGAGGEAGQQHQSMTFSLSKKRELVVRTGGKGRGRGRGAGRERTERRVGGRSQAQANEDTRQIPEERTRENEASLPTDVVPIPHQSHESQQSQVTPTQEPSQDTTSSKEDTTTDDNITTESTETLPQFPAGVGKPKRYSTRRQKAGAEGGGVETADQPSAGPPDSTPSSVPQAAARDGLLPTPAPAPPQPTNQMPVFEVPDLEQQMKMLQFQQEMVAAHPELLNYQAAMMSQQNPVLLQQMQYMWLQQQQALQQSMMQAGMHPPPPSLQEVRGDGLHPPAHPLQDPLIQAAHGDGGMVPQAGGAGYATPGGLFVPSLAQQQQWRQAAQQQGGKARSQAIPIVSPEEKN